MSTLALAFSCEAYINLYGIDRLGKDVFNSCDRLALEDKWIIIPKIATGKTFNKGSEPFQTLSRLVRARNDWVHAKPQKELWEFDKPRKINSRKLPNDNGSIQANIKQVRFLVNKLHSFDNSQPLSNGFAIHPKIKS